MKIIFYCFLFTTQLVAAQKLKKADQFIVGNLQTHISYLSNEALEGRRTGTKGEKLAYEYISNEFLKAGLQPKGDNAGFIQTFTIEEGRELSPTAHLLINGSALELNKDYFPLNFSSNSTVNGSAAIALQENGAPWFYDLKELLEANKNNPHFNLLDAIRTKAAYVAKKRASAFLVYNSSTTDDELSFDARAVADSVTIPVIYITKAAKEKYFKDELATLDVQLKTELVDKKRYGHNVIGFIDNKATNTVIIGAHYDHLGYGEDHNSLYLGTVPMVHHGADDNASGTAAVIELSKLLKAASFKNNNYLLICFSGEELGLFGSKYFTEHATVDITKANYMINLDMVGRLNDSTRRFTIGGYGTSPVWAQTLPVKDKFLTVKFDSTGAGPSDHTSFYRKNIPVLFFFTGLHSDYHKPTDVAAKINYSGELMVIKYIYNLIDATNKKGRIAFTKTKETAMGTSTSFKVTLGIMPDYSFTGMGVRADGISDGRPAEKAGLKAGDVIVQLGDFPVTDLQTYMQTLNKFNKGQATKVKLLRANKAMYFDIVF